MPKSSNFVLLHMICTDRGFVPRHRSVPFWFAWIVSVLVFFLFFSRVYGDLAADARGLTVLKQSIDLRNILNWKNTSDVCRWQGVTCGVVRSQTTQRVIQLRLPGARFSGSIPPNSVSQITELRVLNLHSNSLSGSIPSDLTNCTFIRSIYLQNNLFSGSLPSDFSVWPNLVHVVLSFNEFDGSMPTSLAELQQIKTLDLQNNSLTGSIPALNMSSLEVFNISYNRFTGSIPLTVTYRKFNQSSFLGNSLCGFPLPACAFAPAPSGVIPNGNRPHKKKLSGGAIAGIVIGGVVLLLLLLVLCCLAYRRTSSQSAKQANPYGARLIGSSPGSGGVGVSPETAAAVASSSEPDRNRLVFFEGTKYDFNLEDLLRASAEVLGKGSVGTSYKAIMEAGTIVAVKRLKDVSLEKSDFELKMDRFGKLKHENLVPLIAYYYSGEEKLLVSNYMANGSLSAVLHGNKEINRTPLDWDTRVRIAIGAAQGINHLHGDDFIHGNIKSSNILLTSNYTGCVSDFGLYQLVSASSPVSRMTGYRAPEVTDIRKTTPKSDVYSFGVLLLEILTGKTPSQDSMDGEGLDLPRWAQSVSRDEEDWPSKVFDPQLTRYEGAEEEMVRMLDIALECVQPSPDQRPTMREVVERLENCKQHSGVYSL